MGKGRQPHVGRVIIGGKVDNFTHVAAHFCEGCQLLWGDTVIAQFQLQIGNQGAQIGIAAAFAIAIDRSLHHSHPRLNRRKGIGYGCASIVVGVNAQAVQGTKMRHHLGDHCLNLMGQTTAIGIAEN